MYPYYPADDLFIDFANPFHKFALLIKYKNTKVLELESKIEYLEARKWNVFVLESKSVTHSALSIFEFENLGDQTDFEEMTDDQRTDFFKKYSLVNSECFAEWINKYTN